MDISQIPPTCDVCGDLLGFDAWGCLLCGRLLCARHLVTRKGVAICEDCQAERRRIESASVISDADEDRIITLVVRDLVATIGAGLEGMAAAEAARVRLFTYTLEEYEQKVVDDIQQRLHDERLDTTWPTCPWHANHPMWYANGLWSCPERGVIAKLGDLANL